jgi:hypothetical protein
MGNSGKYQYDSLQDPDSRLSGSFRDQSLPRSLPLSLRTMALEGATVHDSLRRRDVFFWDQAGLLQLMEHIDTTDPYISGSEALFIDRIRLYEKRGLKYRLDSPLTTLVNDGALSTRRVRDEFQMDDPQVAARSICHVSFSHRPPAQQVAQVQTVYGQTPLESQVDSSETSGCARSWDVIRICIVIGFVIRIINRCSSGEW